MNSEKFIPEEYSLAFYKYKLPEELIAQMPASNRDDSRLLVLRKNNGSLDHKTFKNLADFFSGEEIIVVNESKVIPARLMGVKETGGRVELLVLNEINKRRFRAMYKSKRGLKPFLNIKIKKSINNIQNSVFEFIIKCISIDEHGYAIFELPEDKTLENLLSYGGITPLPPYIKRKSAEEKLISFDRERYQTIYAKVPGSVAAPTAGLHFTEEMLLKLKVLGVKFFKISHHVGPGTFKPIKCEDVRNHYLDEEEFFIAEETANFLNTAIKEKRPIVAVGTTVVRALESSFEDGSIRSGKGMAKIYIMPGYKFNVVNRLVTNFHLPGSSLILLVSAFTGREKLFFAYKEAVEKRYRFYSYGDCMLIY